MQCPRGRRIGEWLRGRGIGIVHSLQQAIVEEVIKKVVVEGETIIVAEVVKVVVVEVGVVIEVA